MFDGKCKRKYDFECTQLIKTVLKKYNKYCFTYVNETHEWINRKRVKQQIQVWSGVF